MKDIMYKHIVIIFVTLFLINKASGQSDSLKIESDTLAVISDTTGGNTMSLLFIGDIMGHGPQIRSAYDPVKKEYNYLCHLFEIFINIFTKFS